MSMMGELKFFLGLQVRQSPRSIFISQSQYAIELLKKHGLDECVSMSTQGTPTDQTTYRRMIGGLMYLTVSRPDIVFATFVCARYEARPTVKHLKEVKRIFRYIRQSYNMELWYPKDSGFELIWLIQIGPIRCKDDYKELRGLQFLGGKVVSWSLKKQDCTVMSTAEAEYVSSSACCGVIIMAQQQHAAEVHPDELCPPNKRYDLMDANKNVDLEHVQCPLKAKISDKHQQNNPLRIQHCSSLPPYHGYYNGTMFPLTQSQLTESTQGTHRIPSAPRSPNPKMDEGESSAPKRSTVIHFHLPERRSTCLTPPAPVPTIDKADEMVLQDTLQISLAEHKSQEEQEARENVELDQQAIWTEEIDKNDGRIRECYSMISLPT
ncbi:hypothetical protein Tco_1155970 [Tanacetum coccineum]